MESQSSAAGLGPGFTAFKTRNGDVNGHPRYVLFSTPLWALPALSMCHAGVASQMIRNNRQALPPRLPTSFCQESTSMENTIIMSSLHHTQGGRMQAEEGKGRCIGKVRNRKRKEKERNRCRDRDRKRAMAKLVLHLVFPSG